MSGRLIVVVCLSLAAVGVAQAQDSITFYENGSYGGYSFTLRDSESNFGRPGLMNDKASSIRVSGGRWEICSDGGFRGRCVEVTRDSRDLGEFRLNDALSSARYLGSTKPRVAAPPTEPAVPVAVQREMLQRRIRDTIATEDLPGALKLFNEYRALPGKPAPAMLILEAKVAILQGDNKRATNALTQYFNQVDESDADYEQALDLFETANGQ